ncbi:enoyl-CoA hydratase [Pedobacter sp. HMF7647]|uniref:Enoyl-CoA hydratase n=1 Tax=Hufsiella arboris TaxID=2695275 RepID=A0A7K1Y8S5_9SPHI|nr:enoyl-CoA hydratase-related protein [Hufsiella arboris]MXV50469.1 enoyl-CoA hydratase [Hufsiella arboris]
MYFKPEDLDRFEDVSLSLIKTELADKLLEITLNRPEKRNAFTPTMIRELAFALEYAQRNSDIWNVIIKAEGPVFCAGMDLKVFKNPDLDQLNPSLPVAENDPNLGDIFRSFTKPSIACVEGNVYAGGFLIVAGCTFAVASREVDFSLTEVQRGLFPMQVMGALLPIMPARKVLELCLLAKTISAPEAHQLGLISHVSDGDVTDMARSLSAKLMENAPLAIHKGLEAYNWLRAVPEEEKFKFLAGELDKIRLSEDFAEGLKAFEEKRKPVWKNK